MATMRQFVAALLTRGITRSFARLRTAKRRNRRAQLGMLVLERRIVPTQVAQLHAAIAAEQTASLSLQNAGAIQQAMQDAAVHAAEAHSLETALQQDIAAGNTALAQTRTNLTIASQRGTALQSNLDAATAALGTTDGKIAVVQKTLDDLKANIASAPNPALLLQAQSVQAQLRLVADPSSFNERHMQEKWFFSPATQRYYCIKPGGELCLDDGRYTIVSTFDANFYANVQLLINPGQAAPASALTAGQMLQSALDLQAKLRLVPDPGSFNERHMQEKWFFSPATQRYYCIKPGGELCLDDGNYSVVAVFDSRYYGNVQLLTEPGKTAIPNDSAADSLNIAKATLSDLTQQRDALGRTIVDTQALLAGVQGEWSALSVQEATQAAAVAGKQSDLASVVAGEGKLQDLQAAYQALLNDWQATQPATAPVPAPLSWPGNLLVPTGAAFAFAPESGIDLRSAAFSPDGQALFACWGKDGSWNLAVMDAATGTIRQTIPAAHGNAFYVKVTPDGKTLLTAGYDHQLKVWGLAGGGPSVKQSFSFPNAVTDLAISSDGSRCVVAVANFFAAVIDLGTGHRIDIPAPQANQVAFSTDGKTVYVSNKEAVWECDATTGEVQGTVGRLADNVYAVAPNSDGKVAFAGAKGDVVVAGSDGTVITVSAANGNSAYSLAWVSPMHLAVGRDDGTVEVYRVGGSPVLVSSFKTPCYVDDLVVRGDTLIAVGEGHASGSAGFYAASVPAEVASAQAGRFVLPATSDGSSQPPLPAPPAVLSDRWTDDPGFRSIFQGKALEMFGLTIPDARTLARRQNPTLFGATPADDHQLAHDLAVQQNGGNPRGIGYIEDSYIKSQLEAMSDAQRGVNGATHLIGEALEVAFLHTLWLKTGASQDRSLDDTIQYVLDGRESVQTTADARLAKIYLGGLYPDARKVREFVQDPAHFAQLYYRKCDMMNDFDQWQAGAEYRVEVVVWQAQQNQGAGDAGSGGMTSDGKIHTAAGDILTPMTRESLQRILADAQKDYLAAQQRGDNSSPVTTGSLLKIQAAQGLLRLIPAGKDVPDLSRNPSGTVWAAVIQRTTTDPTWVRVTPLSAATEDLPNLDDQIESLNTEIQQELETALLDAGVKVGKAEVQTVITSLWHGSSLPQALGRVPGIGEMRAVQVIDELPTGVLTGFAEGTLTDALLNRLLPGRKTYPAQTEFILGLISVSPWGRGVVELLRPQELGDPEDAPYLFEINGKPMLGPWTVSQDNLFDTIIATHNLTNLQWTLDVVKSFYSHLLADGTITGNQYSRLYDDMMAFYAEVVRAF